MNCSPIFRVAPYSVSTSRITAHRDQAADLFKFLGEAPISLEPMVDAQGTVLLAMVGEDGKKTLVAETEMITFIADATPSILQPILLRWLESQDAESAAASAEDVQETSVVAQGA